MYYQDKNRNLLKYRWLLTVGILVMGLNSMAQRNNVWLLHTYNSFSSNFYYSYVLDFNYCPPVHHSINLESDKYLRQIHTWKSSQYIPFFANSFCDTGGIFTFTELIGQHYYNKLGKIYDSTYINDKYDRYRSSNLGSFISSGEKTYYFKPFEVTYYDTPYYKPWSMASWYSSDSIVICVSEFDNAGVLIKKNTPIFSFLGYERGRHGNGAKVGAFGTKMIDPETIEIIISAQYVNLNYILDYNLKTGIITKKQSLATDSINHMEYSTLNNKIATYKTQDGGINLFEQNNSAGYDFVKYIDFKKYPPLPENFTLIDGVVDYCFSSNDSIIFATIIFKKDIAGNKPSNEYLIAFNYYKPYTDYKIISLLEAKNRVPGNYYLYFLKLGPDGNIYGGSNGKKKGRFRVLHPNKISTLKFEWMPDIDDGNNQPNYFLEISTLEDYKKTEFVWQPTCDSLKLKFTNTCDTQHFKRYQLFMDNGDSLELNKNWNTKVYNYPKEGKYYVRLKAFSKGGGFIWYGDSIEIHSPPLAKFGIQKTKGCQWIGYGFNDSSQLFGIKPDFKPYKRWFFGDGKDSIDAGTNPKLTYTYTTSNTFTVKLVVNNGYCTDTATQLNNVVILPAPKPGIIAAPINGCTPLKVDFKYKYSDVLDSAVWRSGSLEKFKGITGNFTYNQIGYFFLNQKLYGPSGCITTDSVLIKVNPGISGMPDLLNATVVNENSIDLKWKKHLNAISYSIVKNNNFLTRTTDTSFTDNSANTLMPNSYTIKAISICNDSTKVQDLAQTIYLQAQRTDNNEAKLNWTAYQRWDAGVNTYQLFTQNEAGYFELMATLNGQTSEYLDESFAGISEPQKCYKIIADEKEGNLQQSASNIYCLPLKPVLLIPSAFSPNGDGVNDTWKISYKGIKEANIKIFNRWGEVIYKYTTEKPEWDAIYKGLPVPVGTYFYQIEAIGIKEGKLYKNGLVEVVR